MNYIRHLNAFFSVARCDNRLTSSHVSLYMALFQYWNFNRFQNPFPVYRDTMMQLSKIGSKNTYHKCIKELHMASYIVYHPAISKYQPVKISMIRLDIKETETKYNQLDMFAPAGKQSSSMTGSNPTEQNPPLREGDFGGGFSPNSETQQVSNLTAASTDINTPQVPKLGHLIKPNILKKRETPAHKIFERNKKIQNALNNLAHVPNVGHTERSRSVPIPTLSEVEEFFKASNYATTEAKKFFNHYKAIGWKIQGVAPIEEWKALVEKWMENAKKWNREEHPASKEQPKNDINYLYESFLEGKKIFYLIQPTHFDELKLKLTDQIMQQALKERINQVSGTNNHSLNQLWQAYLSNNREDQLLQIDKPNLIALAKRFAVINYFKNQQQAGITVLSS